MAKYEPTSFFFTDYNQLTTPAITEAFGPVGGNSTTQYRTTSFVNGSGKVYAICSGQLLIQPQTGSTDKVNLILKPGKSYNGPKVKYFIYRNVNMADLINGNNLVDKNDADPNQPDIVKRIWKEFLDFNMPFYNQGIISTPPDTIPAIQIGYGQKPATTLIDHVFSYKNATEIYQIPSCSIGEFIGNFTGKIGLDVVLDYGDYELTNQDELFRLDLAFARANNHVFDTASLTNSTPVKVKQFREHISQFMDAAALWGSHINCGTIETVHGDKKTSTEIGNDILSKYFTKDKIYIYIQGEHDRSYNYYESARKVYGFNPAGEIATTYDWPILIKVIAANTEKSSVNVQLYYDISLDADPPQRKYALDLFSGNNTDLSIYPKETYVTTTPANTHDISINFAGHAGNSCSTFAFIHALLKGVVPIMDYYNELWTPNIDTTQLIINANESGVFWANYVPVSLVDLTEIFGTAAKVQQKVIFDNGLNPTTNVRKKRRLYSTIIQKAAIHNAEFNEYQSPEVTSGSILTIQNKEQYFNALYNDINFAIYKGTFTDSQISANVSSLCLAHHQNFLKKNSYFQLGITDEEYNKLIYDNPVPITTTPQILPLDAQNAKFYLSEVTTFINNHLRKYELGLWYEDTSGNRITTALFPSTVNKVFVYSMDNQFFFSKEYSDHQEHYALFAKAKVEFRTVSPAYNITNVPVYNGEFFFDWLRVNDFPLDANLSYEDILINGYKRPSVQNPNIQYPSKDVAYNALVREYKCLPTQIVNDQYYASYISLIGTNTRNKLNPLPIDEADLAVMVTLFEDVGTITFEYNANYLKVTPDKLNNKVANTNHDKEFGDPETIKITSLTEFAIPQQIFIWAFPLNSSDKRQAKLAGIIFVNANDSNNISHIKAALIPVQTDINTSGTGEVGIFMPEEIQNFHNSLYQYFIAHSVDQNSPILDLRLDQEFIQKTDSVGNPITSGFIHHRGGLIRYNKQSNVKLHKYLKDAFLQLNPQYQGYFLFFSFDLKLVDEVFNSGVITYKEDTFGNVDEIGEQLVALYHPPTFTSIEPRDFTTLNHEAMHGFGLRHTHLDGTLPDFQQKYYYPKADLVNGIIDEATDNVMSYNPAAKILWQWQKQFIKTKYS